MPRNDSATILLDVEPNVRSAPPEAAQEDPFVILVLGAFSGAAPRHGGAPVEIDRDNFDEALARFAPELNLQIDGAQMHLRFRELDDFHPDSLFRRVPLFRAIEEAGTEKPRAQAAEAPAGLLDAILAETPRSPGMQRPARVEDANDLRGFIDRIIAPHLAPREDPSRTARLDRMRLAQMGLMRAILHAPEYQRLEAAWRGVHFLARRIETGPALKIFIADEGSAGEIPHAPRDLRWSVIVLDRAFGRSEESLDALRRLGAQAMAKNAALLAEAEPPGGDSGENARWAAFRRMPEALHIGLALPRLIARMPYGQSGETTEVFPFEEMDSAPAHSQYLWMNPAFGIAYLLAVAFERGGWRAMPGTVRDIDQLPLHVAKVNGEFAAKPCAELWLTESEIEQVLDAGLMAIASIRDTDRVKLVRLQCAAEPVCGIAGPWDRMS